MLLLLRLVGMVAAGVAGWQLGITLAGFPAGTAAGGEPLRYVLVLALALGALGLLLTPYATIVPLRYLWGVARRATAGDLLGGTLGLLVGLSLAALAAFPISLLPSPLGRWLPAVVAILLGSLGLSVGAGRKEEFWGAARAAWRSAGRAGAGGPTSAIILDTSAIVDGRIVAVILSGFITGALAVPRFVLEELQLLADAPDAARRQRGRRGLDMLERLQQAAPLDILDTDFPDLRGVDSKLIRLAKQRHAAIVTTDYNLNRVAGLQGVAVLNINDLANALRSVLIPGEELSLDIVQEGRERGQGIGYLEDGTMVVVEGGRRAVGTKVDVEVTRILPTAGGRIVFGRLRPAGVIAERDEPPPDGRRALRVVRDEVSGDRP
jgi:uncharacterized protein YacL